MKKVFSLLVVVCLLVSVFSINVFAAEETEKMDTEVEDVVSSDEDGYEEEYEEITDFGDYSEADAEARWGSMDFDQLVVEMEGLVSRGKRFFFSKTKRVVNGHDVDTLVQFMQEKFPDEFIKTLPGFEPLRDPADTEPGTAGGSIQLRIVIQVFQNKIVEILNRNRFDVTFFQCRGNHFCGHRRINPL